MTRRDIANVTATTLLAIVAVTTYVAGIWTAWGFLFHKLPMPFGYLCVAGCVVAPVQLIIDLIKEKKEKTENETAG